MQRKEASLQLFIPKGPRLGNLVVEADRVKKSFEDRILVENMSFSMPPGAIIGIIGPNGAGKTPFLR